MHYFLQIFYGKIRVCIVHECIMHTKPWVCIIHRSTLYVAKYSHYFHRDQGFGSWYVWEWSQWGYHEYYVFLKDYTEYMLHTNFLVSERCTKEGHSRICRYRYWKGGHTLMCNLSRSTSDCTPLCIEVKNIYSLLWLSHSYSAVLYNMIFLRP